MSQIEHRHLIDIDPQTAALIAAEERRQREKIILIPSESLTPKSVRDALGSAFSSVYAEGYPRKAMMKTDPSQLAQLDVQMASYRRYADRRFYKGAEYADVIESLAGRRAAACFATDDTPAECIYANVQPLSGAAANLAVYDAFVRPGETVMGMALTEGGHLTHGSEFNVTGKRYKIVSYAVDPSTGKLNYDTIAKLAEESRPKMIIGGFTSYPWQPDWHAFREIADRVGAVLLADVAHTAGLIVGRQYPNPIGIADVVSFTTHKTLCGPRGAVILSTDPAVASAIDSSIFPGHQGGPHVNKFAGLAVALQIALQPEFKDLQRRIVENCAHLATALEREGLTVAYGGTDTHLLLVDLRPLSSETGFVMMGEVASRILDLVGIVCNKNTIPGDTSAADAHGIRLGTPWATQRGMTRDHMDTLASIIARVLKDIRPFTYQGLISPLSRGKLSLPILEQARREVRALISSFDADAINPPTSQLDEDATRAIFRLHGGRVRALLNEATPADILALELNEPCKTFLFDESGQCISTIVVAFSGAEDAYILAPQGSGETVGQWLRGLADGYIIFDEQDVFRKVQGPALVESWDPSIGPERLPEWMDIPLLAESDGLTIQEAYARHPEQFVLSKPYFIGQELLEPSSRPLLDPWSWEEPSTEGLLQTALHGAHLVLGARMVPFSGWEMPVWYDSALAEHKAVRTAAGLFDLGHMGVFHITGRFAREFLDVVTSNYASWLEDGASQYAYLFDAEGNVLDDVMIYRRAWDRYLVVVNAVNERKDWAWLTAINEGRTALSAENPALRVKPVELRDLKRERGVVDLALQGPASFDILSRLLREEDQGRLAALDRTEFGEFDVEEHQLLVARTGYTGETMGYEIYVGGSSVLWLWARLIELGSPMGMLPCGLASRDSTRAEAGLPLYGHELAGPHNMNPFEAGFGSYIKLHKAFFVGRRACVNDYISRTRSTVRFKIGAGNRRIQEGAVVAERNGTVLGHVTSCVSLANHQVGLAVVDKQMVGVGTELAILNVPRSEPEAKPLSAISPGDRIAQSIPATVISRFKSRQSMPQAGEE